MSIDRYELITRAAQHARDLRAQVGPPLEASITATASKTVMMHALQAAELDLLLTMSALMENGISHDPVCGVWNMQNLVGHLADWDIYYDNWLSDLTGKSIQDLYWDEDGDAFNAWLNEQRRGNSWDRDWHDFRGKRHKLVNNLGGVSDDAFLREVPNRRIAHYPTVYHCAWSALEHYLDHAAGLRRRTGMPVPEELLQFHGPYTEW